MAKEKIYKTEEVTYVLKPHEWFVDHHFGVGYHVPGLIEKDMSESISLGIQCEIESPKIKNVVSTSVAFIETKAFDDCLQNDSEQKEFNSIGEMHKYRGEDHLNFLIFVSSHFFNQLSMSIGFGKIKIITIFGEKLRYGKGKIYKIYIGEKYSFSITEGH